MIDKLMLVILLLTIIIHCVNTLAYSVRIVGVRTGKIAISFALFNVVALGSRFANTIHSFLFSVRVDASIKLHDTAGIVMNLRYILIAATVGSLIAAFLIPTFQRVYTKAVNAFNYHRSLHKLIFYGFSRSGIRQFKENIKMPSRSNIEHAMKFNRVPVKVFLLNIIVVALLSVGVLSVMYASVLLPENRTQIAFMGPIITGVAAIILSLFIDPHLSIMTDDVLEGLVSEAEFRNNVMFMVFGRVIGTIVAQILLVPSAFLIVKIALLISEKVT